MNEAEVKIKMGMDASQVNSGLASAKSQFSNFSEVATEKMHKLHHSIRLVKMALHGFGIGAVLASGLELYEKWKDFWEPYITGAEEAEKETRRVVAAQSEIGKALKESDKIKADTEKEMRGLLMDNMSPSEKKEFLEKELEEINKKKELLEKKTQQIRGTEWEGQGLKTGLTAEEAAQLAKMEVEVGKLNAQQVAHMREIGKTQKEIDKEKEEAQEELFRQEREMMHERRRLEQDIIRGELERVHKSESQIKGFLPTHDQLINGGWYDRRGRFHQSENSKMQNDIDQQRDDIRMRVANKDASLGDTDIQEQMANVDAMQKQLDRFMGVPEDNSKAMVTSLTVIQTLLGTTGIVIKPEP